MARRRYKKMGSIITTRVKGLGRLNAPSSFLGSALPPLVGALVAAVTALGVRWFAKPSQSALQMNLYKFAPLVGFAAGGVASLGLYMVGGTPSALSSTFGAAGAAGSVWGYDMLLKRQVQTATAQAGLGAIVAEYSMRGLGGGKGLGAIVLEPQASRGYGAGALGKGVGSYGETINLGAVNTGAFGTPGFKV